jgi:hypothetical protein
MDLEMCMHRAELHIRGLLQRLVMLIPHDGVGSNGLCTIAALTKQLIDMTPGRRSRDGCKGQNTDSASDSLAGRY